MKRILLFVFLLFTCTSIINAQPPNYVLGTQVCWNFNGRPHGYFKAAGEGERHYLLSFTGNGETNCGGVFGDFQTQSPQKLLKDDGNEEWDGRTVRGPGDTIVWEVLTIANTSDNWMGAYASDIDFFFTHIGPINTSEKWRFHITGLSGGVGRMWGYLTNSQGHNSPYRNIFSTTIGLSGTRPGDEVFNNIPAASVDKRNWVWVGSEDSNPQTDYDENWAVYNQIAGHKYFTLQDGGDHDGTTWDSAWSIKGTDTLSNRWLWMVRQDSPSPPEPCTYTGGPANYVEGTSVCWTFNGRPHGYYRAPGCGERHILVMFTGELPNDNCTDYATNAPEKFLGTTWDGRTVRPNGDSIKWEILTIMSTSDNWMGAYASDINYFFDNIDPIDTDEKQYFHVAGLSEGVGRMWGFLNNDQGHNSPYRDVFSTTISMSCQWIDFSKAANSSHNRRNWVWYGSADTDPFTPPAASVSLYNALNGYKRSTSQTGGTHGANTWDNCMGISGTDSNSNRWLWMAGQVGGTSKRPVTPVITEVINEKEMPVTVFPNPGYDKVFVRFNEMPVKNYKMIVTDMNGKVYKVITTNQLIYELDVSGLAKGMYILQIDNNGVKTERKLLKN